jgi:ssDNA-binding Zn-finger/Zn-ribbon topoisomerase 1
MLKKIMEQNNLTAHKIRNHFDQTLKQHIERLIGTSVGIGVSPLNCATISCLILLTERENEIESFGLDPSERYSKETFLVELAELGLELDSDLKKTLQEMTQKGYTHVDDDGRVSPKKLATSMARLLDRIFPGMPGMNLVAYFVQTMDEVQSGRKDLEFAISQFDQTLQMKGVPVKKGCTGPRPDKAVKLAVKRKAILKKIELPHISPSESKILSFSGHSGRKEIKPVHFGEVLSKQNESPESCPETLEKNSAHKPDMEDTHSVCEDDLIFSEHEEQEKSLLKHSETELEQIKSLKPEETFPPSEKRSGTKSVSNEHGQNNSDDIIEKRIAAFEEDLAMQCPLCKSAKIQANETAMGKVYYKCSDRKCNFVSWGKPYHMACPQCNNPFLVEVSDRHGKKIIKCPRATCRYRQKSPLEIADEQREKAGSTSKEPANKTMNLRKPPRKVVRRRVVKRKR